MTISDSRQRPNAKRNPAAASTVRTMIVGVADSVVMILLSDIAVLLAVLHEPPRHVRVPTAEAARRKYVGDDIPQQDHQRGKAECRDDKPPHIP